MCVCVCDESRASEALARRVNVRVASRRLSCALAPRAKRRPRAGQPRRAWPDRARLVGQTGCLPVKPPEWFAGSEPIKSGRRFVSICARARFYAPTSLSRPRRRRSARRRRAESRRSHPIRRFEQRRAEPAQASASGLVVRRHLEGIAQAARRRGGRSSRVGSAAAMAAALQSSNLHKDTRRRRRLRLRQ